MKKVLSLMLALAMVFALASCGSNGSTDSNKGGASAASSATTDEKKDTPADSGKALSGTVSTNGSTSMEKVIGSLMEEFMAQNKDVTVTYDPTGSGTGIESASNGSCDIGLSSRALKDTETGLVGTTVALDGIAVIVNANCGVDDLSVEQISKIYTGEITNWSEVGGADLEIACIGRESGSGTRDGFESITDTKDKCVLRQGADLHRRCHLRCGQQRERHRLRFPLRCGRPVRHQGPDRERRGLHRRDRQGRLL